MELVSKLFYLSPSASSKVLTFEKSWNPVIRCVCWKVILVRTGFVISIPGAVSLLQGRICKHFPFHWEISVEGWRLSPQLHLQENKCIVFLELLQHPVLSRRLAVGGLYRVVIIAWLWVFMLSKIWSKQFVMKSLWAKVIGSPSLDLFRCRIGTQPSCAVWYNQVCRPGVEEDDLHRYAGLGRNC